MNDRWKKFLMEFVILLFVVVFARLSLVEARIVGGEEAEPGNYPYFVDMGPSKRFCGGALVAPDMVLFAAHCGNWTGQQLVVGAYQKESNVAGGQSIVGSSSFSRFCQTWVPHANYNEANADYDFALCKLDEPVAIDESRVKLVLNPLELFPDVNDELRVMGFGSTESQNGPTANVLREVTVPYRTNQECNQPNLYNGRITESMLCAGDTDKDACSGDSGAPLVFRRRLSPAQRTTSSSSSSLFQDIHVGLVSLGTGCGEPNKPGIYARTSQGYDWIVATMCTTLGSLSSLCNNIVQPPIPCLKRNELTVRVVTDRFADETSWALYDSKNHEVEKRQYSVGNFTNEHTICLESNECYVWELLDSRGDGLCSFTGCGSYELMLDGSIIASGDGQFETRVVEKICTPSGSCDNRNEMEYQIVIQTGNDWGEDVSVTTALLQIDSLETERQLLRSDGFASNTLHMLPNTDEYYCLPKNRCFRFQIYDRAGGDDGGYFRGTLDKTNVIFSGSGNELETLVEKVFCTNTAPNDAPVTSSPTPSPTTKGPVKKRCKDIARNLFTLPSIGRVKERANKTCRWFRRVYKNQRIKKKLCKRKALMTKGPKKDKLINLNLVCRRSCLDLNVGNKQLDCV